jgi:hypothetical protein
VSIKSFGYFAQLEIKAFDCIANYLLVSCSFSSISFDS